MDLSVRGREREGKDSNGKVLSQSKVSQRSPIKMALNGGFWVKNIDMYVSMAGWGGEKEG